MPMKGKTYLGIDVGSVSTNIVAIDDDCNVLEKLYLRTSGKPIKVLLSGMREIQMRLGGQTHINAIGTTGSGRQLASVIVGADVVKTEIPAHAIAAQKLVPNVRTVIVIGGQASKIIFSQDGVVTDFAMITVCAAGTGSFLDRQAGRLEIPIEEFGQYALKADAPVRIAGRCAVFAESDMIHKQQTGHTTENIVAGLCEALVRNYLNNLAKSKELHSPIIFQGGVAANVGIVAAFEKELKTKIIIPEHYDVMGAYGCALLARNKAKASGYKGKDFSFNDLSHSYQTKSIECKDCSNNCEILEICSDKITIARWGDKCGKWTSQISNKVVSE